MPCLACNGAEYPKREKTPKESFWPRRSCPMYWIWKDQEASWSNDQSTDKPCAQVGDHPGARQIYWGKVNNSHQVKVAYGSWITCRYALFAHYQKTVHKEPPSTISRSGFRSFLCSGLGQSLIESNGRDVRIGSYHQCYRLDGQLVAIGVLDLLPHAVSSVYLM